MKTFIVGKDLIKSEIDEIQKRFLEFWEPYFEGDFAIDLQATKKIDEKGLRFLFFATEKAGLREGQATLIHLNPELEKRLRIIGADQKLQFGNTTRVSDL